MVIKAAVIFLFCVFSLTLSARVTTSVESGDIRVVYGEDDRIEVHDASSNYVIALAAAVAARLDPANLNFLDGQVEIWGTKLVDRGVCSSERFADQISPADCTGFLVSEDVLLTAGHCMRDQFDCEGYLWVFDFVENGTGRYIVPGQNVYKCREILAQSLDRITKLDYALIRLERKVEDRNPLQIRKSGRIENNQSLMIIGHPSGLPKKIAVNASVRQNSDDFFFVANLDSFAGNSGSPVINTTTGMVEGILVRGETDYVFNAALGCQIIKQCTENGCRGEDVTRITKVKKLYEILGDKIN